MKNNKTNLKSKLECFKLMIWEKKKKKQNPKSIKQIKVILSSIFDKT